MGRERPVSWRNLSTDTDTPVGRALIMDDDGNLLFVKLLIKMDFLHEMTSRDC